METLIINDEGAKTLSSNRLVLTGEEFIPIYLQLVHQIRYLITSRELSSDAKLPSVRNLASDLGINAGTVAQAYRMLSAEGLIESRQGSGTFVSHQTDAVNNLGVRQVRLQQLTNQLINDAYAMGFGQADIRQHLQLGLQKQGRSIPIVLVAPNAVAAHKYSQLVDAALPSELMATITPCTLDEIKAGDPRVLTAYERAYFTVVAFVPNVPAVSEALRLHGVESELVGLTAILGHDAISELNRLDRSEQHVLFTEARNVNSALGLLSEHANLNPEKLTILTELSSAAQLDAISNERIIYTLGVADLVAQLQLPETQLLELRFTLSQESVERLRSLVPATQAVLN